LVSQFWTIEAHQHPNVLQYIADMLAEEGEDSELITEVVEQTSLVDLLLQIFTSYHEHAALILCHLAYGNSAVCDRLLKA
jgi:hypothetical protein